jgi:hypothetical protein
MYKLVFFVPEENLEAVKLAVFAAGAGKIGDYDQCCWQVLGQGQFRPLIGSNPYIGNSPKPENAQGELTQVAEYRVEMVCEDALIPNVIQALKDAHPYEEPAYDVWQLADIES